MKKPKKLIPLELSDYQSIIDKARVKGKNIWLLCNFLREHRFTFISDQVIEVNKLPISILPEHHQHSFMLIERKLNNQSLYDYRLCFAVKLVGMLSKEVHIYINGNFFETWELPLGHKKENFRNVKPSVKFPKELSYEQRADWRKEHEKIQKNPNHIPSPFYKKYLPQIIFIERKKL